MQSLRSRVPDKYLPAARRAYRATRSIVHWPLTITQKYLQTPALLLTRQSRTERCLEIGPGEQRIPGFETLNVVGGINVDYVWKAEKRLPFRDGTFKLIYASHILEHIPWFMTEQVLAEWIRVIVPGGRLEIWVPDGVKICSAFVAAETQGANDFENDGWYRYNKERDPCVWASGRVFSYGDGSAVRGHPNWHNAIFSYRYLKQCLQRAGCNRVEPLDRSRVRGHDHGWINLGICGIKG